MFLPILVNPLTILLGHVRLYHRYEVPGTHMRRHETFIFQRFPTNIHNLGRVSQCLVADFHPDPLAKLNQIDQFKANQGEWFAR
jgi:hypothetical protein